VKVFQDTLGRAMLLRALSLCSFLAAALLIGCSALSSPEAFPTPHITPTYFISAPQRTPTAVRIFPTGTPTPSDGIPRVTVGDNYFEPANLTVRPGAIVEFVHSGNNTHTVTSLGEKWSPLFMGIGTRSQLHFSEPGEYRYICTFHSGMFAIITVSSGS
jgi:hypothetical protein